MTRKSARVILAAIAIAISVGAPGRALHPLLPHFVDETGRAHKPFLVPQRDPESYDSLLKTFSVPELITGPVPVTAEILTQAVVSDQAIEVDGITDATKPAGREEPWQPTRD